MERLGTRYMSEENFGSYFQALVRKVERIETNVSWMKDEMEKDQKHIDQIYNNKEEIQKVKTVGTVLFTMFAFISSFFGFRIK
tara:strand:+ start:696 stop:944 length:249 start_codon:yes stop_codon:yes gene_type:complete